MYTKSVRIFLRLGSDIGRSDAVSNDRKQNLRPSDGG